MMRKTTQLATVTPSVTVVEARTRLRIDSYAETDAATDIELASFITSATDLCAGQTGRSVAKCRWRLDLPDGFPCGHDRVLLSWPDVIEIESIKYIDDNGALQTLPATEYRVSLGEILRPVNRWPSAENVEITYVSGYGTATPEALKHWILLQVGHWNKNREAATELSLAPVPFGDRLLDPYKLPKV